VGSVDSSHVLIACSFASVGFFGNNKSSTQYHPNQDTFLHLLHIKIMDTLEFHKAELLTVIDCQYHGGENATTLYSQDGYPCKLIIACPDEKTHES
jgi:hypothetical protein